MTKTLAELREQKRLTQRKLAELLTAKCKIKVTASAIAMWETGQRTPGLKKAKIVAKFFGISVEKIEFGPCAHDKRTQAG